MQYTKFTQEIKDNWIAALESGKYKQGYYSLSYIGKNNELRYCCIGVLGCILNMPQSNKSDDVYVFLNETIGKYNTLNLIESNDNYSYEWISKNRPRRPLDYKNDYSNVIPLIKTLPTQE